MKLTTRIAFLILITASILASAQVTTSPSVSGVSAPQSAVAITGGTIAGTTITTSTYNGNTLTTGSSTYTGTAGQTYTFPTTSATVARTDANNTFTGTTQTFNGTTQQEIATRTTDVGTNANYLTFGTVSNNRAQIKVGGTNITDGYMDFYTETGGSLVRVMSISSSAAVVVTGSISASTNYSVNGTLISSATAPTISSGFGSSPSVASNNGTATFRINIGTGGTATGGVVGLPTASNGWNCMVQEFAPNATALLSVTVITASSTTSVTVQNDLLSTGAATAWQASQVLIFNCAAY